MFCHSLVLSIILSFCLLSFYCICCSIILSIVLLLSGSVFLSSYLSFYLLSFRHSVFHSIVLSISCPIYRYLILFIALSFFCHFLYQFVVLLTTLSFYLAISCFIDSRSLYLLFYFLCIVLFIILAIYLLFIYCFIMLLFHHSFLHFVVLSFDLSIYLVCLSMNWKHFFSIAVMLCSIYCIKYPYAVIANISNIFMGVLRFQCYICALFHFTSVEFKL